jgi:hypothetical protein
MAEHPIIPPPELMRHWARFQGDTDPEALWFRIATEAAQWGADQELEACCEFIQDWFGDPQYRVAELRAARRPKPPSLKQQALEAFDRFTSGNNDIGNDMRDCKTIRQALEALPND